MRFQLHELFHFFRWENNKRYCKWLWQYVRLWNCYKIKKQGKKRTFWKMEIYQENLYTVMFRDGFTKGKHFLKSILSVWYGGIMLRPICFKRGEWVLITSLREGGIWKIKKVGGSMVQGWVFLKGGGWHFS